MFPVLFEFVEMVSNVVVIFGTSVVQVAYDCDCRLVTLGIMDCFEVGPAVVGSSALADMYHLCGGYIVSNQDSSIGVIKVPIGCSFRVLARIGALYGAESIALYPTDLEHECEPVTPDSPVGVVQAVIGVCYHLIFTSANPLNGRSGSGDV